MSAREEMQPTQELSEHVAATKRRAADSSPPRLKRAGSARKDKFKVLARWERGARQLIALGAGRWNKNEIDASIRLRDAVQAWLQTEGPYLSRKAEGFLRDLDKLRVQALARRSQDRRSTGDQNEYPDRTRITEYVPPGGRGSYATLRRRRK